jgi:hypothetical protein
LVKVQTFSKDIGAPQVLHVAKNLDATSHTSNIHIPFQQRPYKWINIDDWSYRKPQEAQMTSTMVECLQGIQMAKEASD